MMTQPNFRDVELLSAYLDGELPQAESARLEARLNTDPQLRTVFEDLSQSRTLLRKLPARRAPRNFTLTPKMAGVKPPVPRAFPLFRFASALAAVLFFFSFAVNLTVPALSAMRAAPMPAYGRGGGSDEPALEAPAAAPEALAQEAPAVTEAPAMLAPAVPAPGLPAQDAALTPTGEAARAMAAVETETPMPTEMPQAKMSPAEPPAPIPPPPEEVQPPVPTTIVVGLLILALMAGAAALFVRWRADRKFSQTIKKK
jgi:hypothetical protein